ncbi:hypothetical protein OQA88_4764 [Cercophora sp. LCS_1]
MAGSQDPETEVTAEDTPFATGEMSASAGERAPLLDDHVRDESEERRDHVRQRVRLRVIVLCFATIFILELGSGMLMPPMTEITESIICGQMHPEFARGGNSTGDPHDPCRSDDVQSYLAMLRGWVYTFEALPGLILAVPYGILLDRWGRRPVLVLGILGLVLSAVGAILVSSLSTVVGGGGQMVVATLYTYIADVTHVADRATVFFQVGAAYLVSAMIAAPLAGAIMVESSWIALFVSTAILAFGIPTAMLFPETVHLHRAQRNAPRERRSSRREADDGNDGDDEGESDAESISLAKRSFLASAWGKVQEGFADVKNFVAENGSLSFLILSTVCAGLVKFVQEMLLQYATKRYGWSWSRATILLGIRGAMSIVTLLVLLPVASWFCLSRLGMSAVYKDIWLARTTGILAIIGCLITAAAVNAYIAVAGIVWMSLGSGMSGFIRSLLNALVEEHHIGTLNSLIGLMEMAGIAVAGPLLGASFSLGVELGGPFIGLPFVVAAVFTGLATGILFAFKPPSTPTFPGSL